jgi:hypothetical protein
MNNHPLIGHSVEVTMYVGGAVTGNERLTGTFLGFGLTFFELNTGVGHYTNAIVELQDGSVITVDLNRVKFLNGDQ